MPVIDIKGSSAGGPLFRTLLILIAFGGIAVLTGWHLHIPTLVKVIPGAYAMQYNTALCFVVLAASAWALVIYNGRILPVIGGLFVAGIGGLVLVEYGTGVSLWIDTGFFYPWENTLGNPGRMSLITALSFLTLGSALLLITLRPKASASFAICHALPLSLGLTSLLGYLFGVTDLLNLHLGSQMALNTALLCVVYSGVLLHYGWPNHKPADEGLPTWSPAIAIIIVPVLFIGFRSIAQSDSTVAKGSQLILALMGACLLAIAIRGMAKSKVGYKGLILISIPLIFLLAFVGLVRQMKSENERVQSWALHSAEVLAKAESLLSALVSAESSVRGFVITDDATLIESFEESVENIERASLELRDLVKDNPQQEKTAIRLAEITTQRLKELSAVYRHLREGNRQEAIETVKIALRSETMNSLRGTQSAFLQEERRLDEMRHKDVERSWRRFDWLLVAGASADILLAGLLAFLFSRGISKRLFRLTENAQRLAVGERLLLPIRGADEIAELDLVFHDMAKALNDAAQKENALFSNALDVICSIDAEGRFVRVNPACVNLWGYTAEELVGRRFIEFVTPEDIEKTAQADEHIRDGNPATNFENRYVHKDGSLVPVMWSAYWSETESLTFCIARDISKPKQMEAELEQARDAALESARLKAEFLANMSHEIRTPMNGVIGMTDLVLDTTLTPQQRDYLTTVKSSADALLNIINDILDFSKIEAGKLDIDSTAFNLRDYLSKIMRTLALRAHEKELELNCAFHPDVPDALIGDPGRMRQILINLVGNAIKFTRHGEVTVSVGAELVADSGVLLHLCVADTGIGIPLEKQALIFEAFAQSDGSTSRLYGGTGLGLAITSQLAGLMGGRAWVESKPGKGSTFHVTLHFGLGDESAINPVLLPANVQGLPVLVVDDNATNRRIVEEMFRGWQMNPTVVSSGEAALKSLNEAGGKGEPFALVVIDANMPGMDGFTLAEHIKRTPQPNTPGLMMLTSTGHGGDAERCRKLGIAAYLIKPITQSSLLDTVLTVLAPSHAARSTAAIPEPVSTGASQIRLRVLLAEDNTVNQELAVGLLEKRGHLVVVTENGEEAVAALEKESFDIVLMDIQMPGVNGYEATARIRLKEVSTGAHIPIIAMTANAMKGDREKCLEAGMDSYISKPIRADEFFQVIGAYENAADASRGSAPEHSPDTDVPDRSRLLAMVDGNLELLKKVIAIFLKNYPERLLQMDSAIRDADGMAVARLAHSLRGSGGHFLHKNAIELVEHLEQAGMDGDLNDAEQTLRQLSQEMIQVESTLCALQV